MGTVDRESPPTGCCGACGGGLVWSKVRYVPASLDTTGVSGPYWEGSEAVCAAGLRRWAHPCRRATLEAVPGAV